MSTFNWALKIGTFKIEIPELLILHRVLWSRDSILWHECHPPTISTVKNILYLKEVTDFRSYVFRGRSFMQTKSDTTVTWNGIYQINAWSESAAVWLNVERFKMTRQFSRKFWLFKISRKLFSTRWRSIMSKASFWGTWRRTDFCK